MMTRLLIISNSSAGAFENIKQTDIRPVVTDVAGIDDAIQGYLSGILEDNIEKLH